jgi:hypothetical protein
MILRRSCFFFRPFSLSDLGLPLRAPVGEHDWEEEEWETVVALAGVEDGEAEAHEAEAEGEDVEREEGGEEEESGVCAFMREAVCPRRRCRRELLLPLCVLELEDEDKVEDDAYLLVWWIALELKVTQPERRRERWRERGRERWRERWREIDR